MCRVMLLLTVLHAQQLHAEASDPPALACPARPETPLSQQGDDPAKLMLSCSVQGVVSRMTGRRRHLNKRQVQQEMSLSLSQRSMSGEMPEDAVIDFEHASKQPAGPKPHKYEKSSCDLTHA